MDADVIVRARKNLSVAPLCGFIQSNPQAILVVEFFGETPEEAGQKCQTLASDLQKQDLGYAWPVITQPGEQAKVWGVRKNGLGLMLGVKGDRKPIPFIEDACEPACWSALTDDLPDLIDDEQLGRRIKENIMMIDKFLALEVHEGNLNCEFESPYNKILIHGHCHQKSLCGTGAMKQLLSRVPGMCVSEVDSGCCGMAGSFGHEKEHYDLSMEIGRNRLFPAVRHREAGTAVVACGFSCRCQLADGADVKALHWVETIRGKAPCD